MLCVLENIMCDINKKNSNSYKFALLTVIITSNSLWKNMNLVVNPINYYCIWIIQANKLSSPDEGVVEDEDGDTDIKNGHAENIKSLKKKTQKCSKYEHVVLFVVHEYQISCAKIVGKTDFLVYPQQCSSTLFLFVNVAFT